MLAPYPDRNLAAHQPPGQRGWDALDPGIGDHGEAEREGITLRFRPFRLTRRSALSFIDKPHARHLGGNDPIRNSGAVRTNRNM
jgi:hypothetical protein